MSRARITDEQRSFILFLLQEYEEKVLSEDANASLPFRVFAQAALASGGCALGPQLSDRLRERVQRVVRDGRLSPETAERLHNSIARELVRNNSELRSIPAISCPLIPVNRGATIPGADEPCCTQSNIGVGCDAAAGRVYNAKTDGRSVWYAANMFAPESIGEGNNYGALGLTVRSKAAHVLLHEMAHVLHLNPSTHTLFEAHERWYWTAAQLVPQRLLESRNVVIDFADEAEFVASAFAMDNESAGIDACERQV